MKAETVEKIVKDFVQIKEALHEKVSTWTYGSKVSDEYKDNRTTCDVTSRIIAAKVLRGDYE